MDGAADHGDVREGLSPRHRPWGSFAAWLAVGVAYAFAAIGLASVGLFVFPVAVLATVLLARRKAPRAALAGLVAGFGFPPLYVAFLNRSGPGQLCYSSGAMQTTCAQLLNPWPWAAIGLLFIIVGVALFLVASRRVRSAVSRPEKLPD